MESDPLVPPMFFGFTPAQTVPEDPALRCPAGVGAVRPRPARDSYVRQLAAYGLRTDRGIPITDEPYRWSDAVIQTGTASLDFPRQHHNPKVHYVGALLPYGGGTAAADTAATRQQGTRSRGRSAHARTVLVTQGTVDNKDPAKLMIPTIEALKDSDA